MKNTATVLLVLLASACSKPEGEPENPTHAVAAALKEEARPGTPPPNCKNADGTPSPSCKDGDEVDSKDVVKVSAEGAPTRGPKDAPVEIVLFSDFECPYCERAEGTLKQVEAARPGKVKVAFRQRPLPFHEHAALAAKASLAAQRQGRFWPYHDALVEHRTALSRAELVAYAGQVGLDKARFERDLDDPAIADEVAAENRRADQLAVRGTPTAFVNGHRLTGAQPLEQWLALVDAELR